MSDDSGVVSARADGTPEFALPAWLELLSDTSDPARLAHLIVEAIVPGFADSAGIFVLEHMLTGGPVSQPAATEIVVRRLATILTVAGSPIPGAVLPAAQVITFAADSPYARCVRQRAPVIFTQPGDQTMQRVTRGIRTAFGRYASFLAAPLTARDQALGFLVLGRSAGQQAFGDGDAATAAVLGARAGTGIARSLGAAAGRATSRRAGYGHPRDDSSADRALSPRRGHGLSHSRDVALNMDGAMSAISLRISCAGPVFS